MWFLILPSFLNCFLQVLSHLNIRSTMAIISLYVVPHISILFKLLNTNITFKLRSPLGIASSYSSWGNMACGSSHFSCFWSDCCKDHIQILVAASKLHFEASLHTYTTAICWPTLWCNDLPKQNQGYRPPEENRQIIAEVPYKVIQNISASPGSSSSCILYFPL